MNSFFLILLLTFSNGFERDLIDGYVLSEKGNPIEGVHVFFRGHLQSGVTTNSNGYFSIDNTPSTFLVFSHIAYQEKQIDLRDFKNKKIEVVLEEDKILLDEVTISSAKNADIMTILSSVRKNYYNNSCSKNSIYLMEGEHLAREGGDSLIFLKSPFLLKFIDYPRIDADSEINLFSVQDTTIFKKSKTFHTLPYTSEIFLVNSFKWLDIKNIDFIAKPKKYNYVMQEFDSSYVVSFTPLKDRPFMYYGKMEIRKENYALKKIDAKLIFNKKNYYDVISTSKKYPGFRYYYESANINFSFKKDKISHLYSIEKMFLSIHIGRNIKKTDKRVSYVVKTNLKFNKTNQYKKFDKGVNLMDFLYINAEKIKRLPTQAKTP